MTHKRCEGSEADLDALLDALEVMGLDELDPNSIALEFREPLVRLASFMEGVYRSLNPGISSMRPPQVCMLVRTKSCASTIV